MLFPLLPLTSLTKLWMDSLRTKMLDSYGIKDAKEKIHVSSINTDLHTGKFCRFTGSKELALCSIKIARDSLPALVVTVSLE